MIKTIVLTFSATATAMAIAASIFLNTILGAFGLVATSVDTMRSFQASQQIVERMKERHDRKKMNVSKKFAKKSAKRVASGVLAAATIGTVAVAITMTSLEVYDYCEEKRDLQEEWNILGESDVEFDLNKCLKEGKEESLGILNDVKNSASALVAEAMDTSKKYSDEKWSEIKAASLQAIMSTSEAAGELWDSAKSWVVRH